MSTTVTYPETGVRLHWHPALLADIPILSADECLTTLRTLENLRPYWEQRHPVVPFYTLGATNYYDIFNAPGTPYYDKARRLNSLLQEHFGWLYQRISDRLGAAFDVPTGHANRLALPGFNIILAHPKLDTMRTLTVIEWSQKREEAEYFSLPVHVDTPQYVVDWSEFQHVDLVHPLSFTLTLSVPQKGCGLQIWELFDEDTLGLDETAIAAKLASSKTWIRPYSVGVMTVHTGRYYHTAAPVRSSRQDDTRITLQGHVALADGKAILYW